MPPNKVTKKPRRTTKKSTKKAPIQETKVPLLPIADGGIVSLNAKTSNLVTSTIVTVSTEDGALRSEYVGKQKQHVRTIGLSSKDPFLLVPMVITSGILKGRQVFVLEPNVQPDEGCPFLELPPEVRNMIYMELLVHKGGEKFQVTGNQARYIRCWGPTSLQMLRTCHQIYQEAAAIYYGLNNFSFTSTTTLMHYLQKIETSVRFLRTIEIQDLVGSTSFKVAKLLMGATSLIRLQVTPEGLSKYLLYREDDLTRWVTYVFKGMFEAIQKARNNREEVSNIVACKEFEHKCYEHSIGQDPVKCYCSNKRIWEEGVKAEILDCLPADILMEAPARATPSDDKLQPTDSICEPPTTRSSARKKGKISNYANPSAKRIVVVSSEDDDGEDEDPEEEVESSSEAADSDAGSEEY